MILTECPRLPRSAINFANSLVQDCFFSGAMVFDAAKLRSVGSGPPRLLIQMDDPFDNRVESTRIRETHRFIEMVQDQAEMFGGQFRIVNQVTGVVANDGGWTIRYPIKMRGCHPVSGRQFEIENAPTIFGVVENVGVDAMAAIFDYCFVNHLWDVPVIIVDGAKELTSMLPGIEVACNLGIDDDATILLALSAFSTVINMCQFARVTCRVNAEVAKLFL